MNGRCSDCRWMAVDVSGHTRPHCTHPGQTVERYRFMVAWFFSCGLWESASEGQKKAEVVVRNRTIANGEAHGNETKTGPA